MQQRKYAYSLTGPSGTYMLGGSVSVSFALTDGYPTVTANLVNNDNVSALVDAYRSNQLLKQSFTLAITLVGIKTMVLMPDLVITRLSTQENIEGYTASAYLAPRAAAMASTYPGVFVGSNYRLTVKGMIDALVTDFNNRFGAFSIKGVTFEARKDPINLVAPRFIQVPYLDMIKSVAERHGMMAFIDLSSRLRVFVPTLASSTIVRLNKHNVIDSSLVLDSMQSLVS
jgi:hypothetical protein